MKDQFLRRLVAGAPKVLETFDPATGRFMTAGYNGPELGWTVTNQDVMYPLALHATSWGRLSQIHSPISNKQTG